MPSCGRVIFPFLTNWLTIVTTSFDGIAKPIPSTESPLLELDSFMADHPKRSIILDQVYAGVLVRMAALYLLLGGSNDGIDA